MTQRALVDKITPRQSQTTKKADVINPSQGKDIDDTQSNIINTAQNSHNGLPLVQRQTITLKDGRKIIINNPNVLLDSEQLQIRKTGDLIYKGRKPSPNQITQAGLLKDRKNNKIFPVIVINHGNKSSNIPSGGSWKGHYYGEFQGQKDAFDVTGEAQAKVNLLQDHINGAVKNLYASPADTGLNYVPIKGKVSFEGNINNGEWNGSAAAHDLINPETQQKFTPIKGKSEGVFVSATQGAATEAAGHITLLDQNKRGLTGAVVMQHTK